MIQHPIPPIYDENSKMLILGSFPSVKSREEQFFYGHSQNRFWRVISYLYDAQIPKTTSEKTELLLKNNIAVWDVIGACDVVGSADSTIKNIVPNDLGVIFDTADIQTIFVNGKTAEKYYNKYMRDKYGKNAVCLPSTSPANAAWSFERLVCAWSVIKG